MLAIESAFPQFVDVDGTPINNGQLFFGVANQNPETNPITVYFDAAGTQAAAQPIQTINGYAVRNGTPAAIFVNGDYSLNVRNGRGNLVFFAPTSKNPVLDGSVTRNVDAITAVDATGLPDGAVIIAKGRSAAGDGGGGVFRYVSSSAQAADGVTVFSSSVGSGRLFRDGWTLFGFNGNVLAKWAGVTFDGTTDDTVAVQRAEDASVALHAILEFGSGEILITDTISRATGSQWLGQHQSQGLPGFINGTKIKFQPTTTKSLWVPSGAPSLFRVGYLTDGFHVAGNSVDATGNSVYAFDVHGINKSRFANLTITGFRTGFRCFGTINNRFEFVSVQNTYIASVLYDGGLSTTDVWEQPYFANSPIGVQTNGANLGIRFNSPIFESITTYGMNIVKECYAWSVIDGYGEDTPSANVATNALFRIGFDGATLALSGNQLMIIGGFYGGRNAGAVGAMIDVDYTDGVMIGGFLATRFTNVVRTSANTQTGQIVATGWTASSISAMVSDATKVEGFYPSGVFNSGTRNRQNAFFNSIKLLTTLGVGGATPSGSGAGITFPAVQSPSTDPNTIDDYNEYTAPAAACTGAITPTVVWKASKIGNQITLTLPATEGTASASSFFEYGELLPSNLRPVASLAFQCPIRDNGANQTTPGMILINAGTGSIRVFKDLAATSNFTAAATAGIGQGVGTSICWTV